ncbi:hypothetical protein B5181_20375 [Streptomyces sp. 4F]|nr:hypothetical protein B5181_20375 [Streptomyces sp. 4F]
MIKKKGAGPGRTGARSARPGQGAPYATALALGSVEGAGRGHAHVGRRRPGRRAAPEFLSGESQLAKCRTHLDRTERIALSPQASRDVIRDVTDGP